MANHKFKSVDGAVRRIRELTRVIKDRDELLNRWSHERQQLARLASDTPQFYNPLDVAAWQSASEMRFCKI